MRRPAAETTTSDWIWRAICGMCERSWYSVLRINMQATHAMLVCVARDGRNADDVISARRPPLCLRAGGTRTTLSCAQIRAIGTGTTLKSSVTDRDVGQPARLEEMIASWMLILTRSTC